MGAEGPRKDDAVDLIDTEGARTGPVAVKVTQRIRPDSVYVVHGYGQDAPKLRFTHGRGASDSALMSHVAIDPAMGGTGMNVNFVRLEKRGFVAPRLRVSVDKLKMLGALLRWGLW